METPILHSGAMVWMTSVSRRPVCQGRGPQLGASGSWGASKRWEVFRSLGGLQGHCGAGSLPLPILPWTEQVCLAHSDPGTRASPEGCRLQTPPFHLLSPGIRHGDRKLTGTSACAGCHPRRSLSPFSRAGLLQGTRPSAGSVLAGLQEGPEGPPSARPAAPHEQRRENLLDGCKNTHPVSPTLWLFLGVSSM